VCERERGVWCLVRNATLLAAAAEEKREKKEKRVGRKQRRAGWLGMGGFRKKRRKKEAVQEKSVSMYTRKMQKPATTCTRNHFSLLDAKKKSLTKSHNANR